MQEQSEEQILARDCKRGHKEAQKRVFEKYYGLLLGVCLRYAKNREEARDLLQEGFVKIFDRIEQFDESYSFVAWMKKVMVNNAIDNYRKNKHNPVLSEDTDLQYESVADDVISDMTYKEILSCIQLLPQNYRTVFNMHIIEGYNHREIGEQLGITINTSKSHLKRAKDLLREKIEKLRNFKASNESTEQYG